MIYIVLIEWWTDNCQQPTVKKTWDIYFNLISRCYPNSKRLGYTGVRGEVRKANKRNTQLLIIFKWLHFSSTFAKTFCFFKKYIFVNKTLWTIIEARHFKCLLILFIFIKDVRSSRSRYSKYWVFSYVEGGTYWEYRSY